MARKNDIYPTQHLAPVPDTYPTAYPRTSPTSYPDTSPTSYPNTRPTRSSARGFDPSKPLFPGGQSYNDFVANEHHVRDSRGNRTIHAGKRTNDSVRRSMAAGAGMGAAIVGAGSMAPAYSGTWGEFLSPERLASGVPGAVAGAALGAAAAYGIRKRIG